MDLKKISSLSELREQRKKLTEEQRVAIDGVKQNLVTEKEQLTGKVKAQVNQVRYLFNDSMSGIQSLLDAGNSGLQSLFGSRNLPGKGDDGEENSKWGAWKLPAISTIAGLLAAVVTFLLTATNEAEDEENVADLQKEYHPAEANQFEDLPDDHEKADYENFEPSLTLEQQIHAALASYQGDQKEEAQQSTLLAILGMIIPTLLRELMSGNLINKFMDTANGEEPSENPMQDISESIADELEKVKASMVE